MSGEEYKCRICKANPSLQGGIVQEQGKKDFAVVCGLHLTPDGKEVDPKDITGEWIVLASWGFMPPGTSATPIGPGPDQALALFDKVLERILQHGQDGDGFKIVTSFDGASIEASTFPKGRGSNGSPPPGPQPTHPGIPVHLTTEAIFSGMEWKTKYNDNTVEARPDNAWAWAFRADRDGNQNPTQIALQAAIEKAGKKGAEIEGFIYTLGGRDGTLINRKVKGGK